MSTRDYQTTRIWTRTLKKLRVIAALTSERMVHVIDRLADAELNRLRQSEKHGSDIPQDL